MIDDFLRYARPHTLDLAEIDLQVLVSDLLRDFRADPLGRGLAIDMQGTFPKLMGDEALIRQALLNLLRNAAESLATNGGGAGPPAGGADGARRGGRITVRGQAGDPTRGGVRLVVEDNGAGIPPADRPHVLRPFFTTKDHGTGLGLALVQKTAVEHDGQVEVDSEPGRGTRVAIVLPERPGDTAPPGSLS